MNGYALLSVQKRNPTCTGLMVDNTIGMTYNKIIMSTSVTNNEGQSVMERGTFCFNGAKDIVL